MKLQSWETLNGVADDLTKAVNEHNAALANLRRNGSPIYAPQIMREHEDKARATLTAALDQANERAAAFRDRAEAAAAVGRDDPYSWLSTEELQRAALLRPFIAEDVAAASPDALRTLELHGRTGRQQFDRVQAWLLLREAERLKLPTQSFKAAAMPEHMAKAAAEEHEAQQLMNRIAEARPEQLEHIQRDILKQANWDATGQLIGQ